MVDFDKKIINSNKFRQAAIYFQSHDYYCPYPTGTTEYLKYWDRETDRCINGYAAPDGDWISGYYYFYLNYCPILRLTEEEYTDRLGNVKKRRSRTREFPDFYDYDYYYYLAVQEAEDTGTHLAVLKSRGKGYSFKGGSMLVRNYFLIPESTSIAVASETEFLTKDGLITKAWDFMDFIDANTAWAKKRQGVNTKIHRRASMIITDELGNTKEVGYKSEILGVTLKNNPDRIRGKRAKLILWEEAGMFQDILQAWQIARPSVEEDGEAYGLMVAYGTGGSEGDDFEGLRELFYSPKGYNVLEFPNIWDEGADGTTCGFFVPTWTNMSTVDEDGKRLYMDDDGNSLREKAIEFALSERNKVLDNAKDSRAIDRYIAERPINPIEACLEVSGNIFPKKELMAQLALIRTNKKLQNHKQIGDLNWVNGELQWVPKKNGDIINYPLGKNDDPTGSIVIWEHPKKDASFGVYIAGCLLPGEKVYTDRGLIDVETVQIGDKLLSKDGKLVNIINHQRYDKNNVDAFKLQPFGSFRTTTFTEEHPILTTNDFKLCKELTKDDILDIPNRYITPNDDYLNFISSLNIDVSEDLFWFFGLWLGDGFTNINNNSHDIYLTFGKNQKEYANKYDEVINRVFNRKTLKTKNCETRRFTNKLLTLFLNEHFGKYADGKKIPEWIKYLPNKFKIAFIQGYLDSDGSVFLDKGKQNVSFVSINLELLESIQDMLYSLKIANSISLYSKAKISTFNNKEYNCKESYKLKLCRSSNGIFEKIINRNLGWKAKKLNPELEKENKYIEFVNDRIHIRLRNITKTKYTGFVYNFECDTHTYMTRCIVTHNCDPLNRRCYFIVRIGQKR